MKSFYLLSGVCLLAAGLLNAQEVPTFTFSIGGGFVQPVGLTGSNLDTGWNIRGGAGVNFNSHLGANVDLGFDDFGINSSTATSIGVPGGSVHVFSATLDPIVHLNPHGHLDFYVTGGGGVFHWDEQLTLPSVAVVPGSNSFLGVTPAAVPGSGLANYSVNRPGFDIGAGVAFGALGHGKFFAEARYDHIYMTNSHVDYIPVTFGFRW
jgi:opacity protein-like surface antigen